MYVALKNVNPLKKIRWKLESLKKYQSTKTLNYFS